MTMFKCICTSLMLLCVQIESLKLSGPAADAPVADVNLEENPVADVNLEENQQNFYTTKIEVYEDHPMYPSDPGLEYVPDSDGMSVRVNPNFVAERLENFEEQSEEPMYRNRMLVVPEHKLAFCYIEKVGCTQFNMLINRMNGIKKGSVWFRSGIDKFKLKLADVTRENGWFRGIFLRDPQHRFLSAFNSKCLPGHDKDDKDYCIVRHMETRDYQGLFHRATASLEKNYKGGNPHFDPMTNFCGGLSADLSDYDYVGHLDKGYADVQRQVSEMLGKRGIEFGSDFAHIFPAEKPQTSHTTNTDGKFDEFYKPKDRLHVTDYYADDYTLLAKLDRHGKWW